MAKATGQTKSKRKNQGTKEPCYLIATQKWEAYMTANCFPANKVSY
jgi:hypothetical protein